MTRFFAKIASTLILILVLTIKSPYHGSHIALAASTKEIAQTNPERVVEMSEEHKNSAKDSTDTQNKDKMKDLFGDEQVFPFVAGLGNSSEEN